MSLVIQSDFFYSIGASRATKIITPSDPTRETDHLDHDSYYQVHDRELNNPTVYQSGLSVSLIGLLLWLIVINYNM